MLIAHSDVDPVFPAERVLRQFDALPAPKFLLVLHGADPRGRSARTPRRPPTRPTASPPPSFWDRYLGGTVDASFPQSITIDGVTTFVDGS